MLHQAISVVAQDGSWKRDRLSLWVGFVLVLVRQVLGRRLNTAQPVGVDQHIVATTCGVFALNRDDCPVREFVREYAVIA